MENSRAMFSPDSLLLCKEKVGSLEDEEEEKVEFGSVVEDGCDDEYIKALLDREIASGGLQMEEFLQKSRLDGIHYILRTREVLGFGVQTAYVSVTYLDRFLSRRSVDAEKSWAVRLLSMACLSLAAKMEESVVPALSDLCLGDYNFESSVIQRMELLVLNTLEWKMGSITPFAYVHFFANKLFDKSPPRNGVSRTMELILGSTKDVKIMSHRPSVIAAAATLFVMDQGLTTDALKLKISALTSSGSYNIDNIISCYNLVQEMDIARLKLSKGIKSPDLSPIQIQRAEACGNSSVASAAIAKRKRLVFNQNDDVPADKKEKSSEN
ncbi:Cyclin-D2-2 [Sesamum alatum]|uniref:Cyclin-D2-2 n=1 Tax=Sesamum alatum TaxID=300844 RepID=A0AAE2CTU9_9LAMI|nr:Cyclin-D2-2 [Sesamum alatum]